MGVYQDLSGRAASMRALFIRGIATIVALIIATVLLRQSATRSYDEPFKLTLLTESIGEGLLPGSEVKYHGYTIGSVESLEPIGSGGQRMTLVLDGPQASVLAGDTKAKFVPSNSFGTTAVELLSNGEGSRLSSGATLRVGKDSNAASLTALLRSGGEFRHVFDQAVLDQALAVIRKHADLVGPVSQAVLDTARIVTILGQDQKVSQTMSLMASVLRGATNIMPLAAQSNRVVQGFSWLTAPGVSEGFDVNFFAPLDALLVEGNVLVDSHQDWLLPLIKGILNIVSPLSYALGSLAPEYSSLPGLLDKTGELFALAHGGQPIKIDIILDTMPGIENSLRMDQTVVPSPPKEDTAPQPEDQNPYTQAGGLPSASSDSDDDEHE